MKRWKAEIVITFFFPKTKIYFTAKFLVPNNNNDFEEEEEDICHIQC